MTVLVKKHRHIRLLGIVDDHHVQKHTREFRSTQLYTLEEIAAAEKALSGDISSLMTILNVQQQRKLFSFLNNKKLG